MQFERLACHLVRTYAGICNWQCFFLTLTFFLDFSPQSPGILIPLLGIVYSKQFMYPILDCFVNTRILSVYENIDSSICEKIISSDLFSGHHNVYESDSDQIISSNVENNNVSNKLNNLCSLEIKYDVS